MKPTKPAQGARSDSRETQKLEVRYGDIGISAVAAAMQCRGVTKASEQEKEQRKAKERASVLA
jgi:hypothetical protein